jgi:anti-sigma B factor antagonist
VELSIRTDAPRCYVEVMGRFDAHETARFRRAVDAFLAGPAPDVRLDLRQVAFLDSSALAEIVRAMKLARAGGGDLVLTGLSVPVRVILELTGIGRALTIDEEAVADDTAAGVGATGEPAATGASAAPARR